MTAQWVALSPTPPRRDPDEESEYKLHRRFDRLGRLYGDGAVAKLMATRVAVMGLGGVGSFAAEALGRSAIGHLTLVDFDDVCVTNGNRQLQALKGNVGRPKCDILADRLRLVNPQAQVHAVREFYKAESAHALLTPPWGGAYDFVLDCIDNMTAKAHLLAECRRRGIAVVSSMGAAGKLDPDAIKVTDLGATTHCPMARELRRILRQNHGFPAQGRFDIPAVYSTEPRNWPKALSYDGGQGFVCVCPHKSDDHGCDSRSLIDGTVAFVTGAFGLRMAGLVVNRVAVPFMHVADPGPDRRGFTPEA